MRSVSVLSEEGVQKCLGSVHKYGYIQETFLTQLFICKTFHGLFCFNWNDSCWKMETRKDDSRKVSCSYFYEYSSLYFNTKEPVISKIHYTKTLLILSWNEKLIGQSSNKLFCLSHDWCILVALAPYRGKKKTKTIKQQQKTSDICTALLKIKCQQGWKSQCISTSRSAFRPCCCSLEKVLSKLKNMHV